MKKLLVTDIDGTLAHGDRISENVKNTCENLRSRGWDITVATGRILASALKYIRAVGAVSPAIVYDGARIMHSVTGEEIWGQKLLPSVVEEILETVWNFPAGIQVFGNETVLCRCGDEMARRYFADIGVPVDDSLRQPRRVEDVYRIIIYGDPDKIQSLEKRISCLFKGIANAVLAGNGFLDILPLGVSKGVALERLIGSMPEHEKPVLVAAAGDHMNDLDLLKYADIAVTMSDANSSLLDVAQIVLPPASEDGFSRILEPLESAAVSYKVSSDCGIKDRVRV